MIEIDFKPEEMQNFFSEIEKKFLNHNFGTVSKSDFELLIFHYLMKNLESRLSNSCNEEKNVISDFEIGWKLGITPQRVRNLRMKERLVYHHNDKIGGDISDWKKHIKAVLPRARFNELSNNAELTLNDPLIFAEIQDLLERNGYNVYIQLNKKLLVLPLDSFAFLANRALECKEDDRQNVEKLRSYLSKKKNKGKEVFDKVMDLVSGVETSISLVATLLTLLPK